MQLRVLMELCEESNSQKGGEGASPRRGIKHTLVGAITLSISLKITRFLFSLRPSSKDLGLYV